MKKFNIRITLTEEMLGTASADPEVHKTYIASKSPDSATLEEEVAALGVEEVAQQSMTKFPRKDGKPIMWNYQLKGFFKDACSALQRCKGAKEAAESSKIKAFKKVIDGCIFVEPRAIEIHLSGPMGVCERPLRAATAQGERITLASSETVPAGSYMDATILTFVDEHEAAVKEWLDYGRLKGLLQWRNSGKGAFTWEELEELG